MAADIKQRIRLDGEKQYSQALKDAQRNLRTLRSELKAESAELGKNASEQDKARVKSENLKKQIAEQEKIVKTLQDALAEVREKYADNADEIAKYEIKVNNARAALADMQNALAGANDSVAKSGDAFKTAAGSAEEGVVAAKSFAESVGNLASVGESVSGAIEGIFSGMLDSVRSAVGELWGEITQLAGRANDWADLAATWNTTAINIQQWYHAVRASHNDFSGLSQAVARIAVADPKKLAEYAKVSAVNYTDEWQMAMDVMTNLASLDNDKRIKAVSEIFGSKKVEGISDLLNDWQGIVGNLADFNPEEGGVGMTDEQMATMSEIAEKVDHISETWAAFKDSFLAGAFGKLTLDLAGSAQGILDSLIDFMSADSAEEREKAIEDLKRNMTDFFTRLGQAIGEAAKALGEVGDELSGSEDGAVAAIGKALTALSDVLEWFTDSNNIDTVIHGLETLAAFWIAGKGLAMAGKIASVAGDIKAIQLFSALSSGAGAAGGLGGAASAAGASVSSLGSSIAGALGSALAGVTMAVTVAGFAAAAIGALGFLVKGDWKGEQEEKNKAEEITGVDMTPAGAVKAAGQLTGEQGKEAADRVLGWLLGNHKPVEPAAKTAQETPKVQVNGKAGDIGSGIALPTVRTPKGTETGFDITEAQRTAAEAFFDAWKELDLNPNSEEADKTFDETAEQFEAAFAGQEKLYNMLMDNMDVLKEKGGDNWTDMKDLPASWFRNAWEGQDNQITSSDLSGFRSLPDSLYNAVLRGASSGVSGIQVTIDGYTAGRIIAPYVSQEIARGIN